MRAAGCWTVPIKEENLLPPTEQLAAIQAAFTAFDRRAEEDEF